MGLLSLRRITATLICLLSFYLGAGNSFAAEDDAKAWQAPNLGPVIAPSSRLEHRLILIGDAGAASFEPWQQGLAKAAEIAKQDPEQTSVALLGDNIYYWGFPRLEDSQEDFDEDQLEDISHLEAQLHIGRHSGAEVFVVPGNHDWYATELDGQAAYVRHYAEQHSVRASFLPYQQGRGALPVMALRDGLSLIFYDSNWLLENNAELDAHMAAMQRLIDQSMTQKPDNIIVIHAHHPIETMGPHNKIYDNWIYPLIIKVIGFFAPSVYEQDIDHPKYAALVAALEQLLGQYQTPIIYAAGHDHSLQVFGESGGKNDGSGPAPQYRLVSGAGSADKITNTSHNDNSLFASAEEGFMVLEQYAEGSLLSVYGVSNDLSTPLFSHWLWRR